MPFYREPLHTAAAPVGFFVVLIGPVPVTLKRPGGTSVVLYIVFSSTIQSIDMSPTALMLPMRRFVRFVTHRCRAIAPTSGEGLAAAPLVDSGCIKGCTKGSRGAGAWTYGKPWEKERAPRERDIHADEPVRECSQLQVDREHSLSGESETPTAHR